MREYHVRFYESAAVRSRRATHPLVFRQGLSGGRRGS